MNEHKDGNTARCPWFETRISFLGGHWIKCTGRCVQFPDKITRDAGYAVYCCKYPAPRPDRCELERLARTLWRDEA